MWRIHQPSFLHRSQQRRLSTRYTSTNIFPAACSRNTLRKQRPTAFVQRAFWPVSRRFFRYNCPEFSGDFSGRSSAGTVVRRRVRSLVGGYEGGNERKYDTARQSGMQIEREVPRHVTRETREEEPESPFNMTDSESLHRYSADR